MDNPEDLILINKEKDICEKYKINFKQFNLNERTSDAIIRKYIKEIKLLPKPLIIHNFKSDDVSSKRFIALYN